MILKGAIDLPSDRDECYSCPRWLDYSFDPSTGMHQAVLNDCRGEHSLATKSPGEMYSFLAPFRDNPEVLDLVNWLV